LVERSEDAALVVVGRSGRSHRVLGTVAEQVARHARCPVVVVPPTTVRGGRIVVGMDGSAPATAALLWARDESQRTGTPVVALLAWTLLEQLPPPGGAAFDPHYDDSAARAALDAALSEVLGVDAGAVGREVVNDLPDTALVAAGATADAVVIGSRGLGGFETLLLGSVATKVLERSPCPAVVITAT
jgi:nucleotide-binding universal stress UspA family protein